MTSNREILDYLNELTGRELDILVAKYVFSTEIDMDQEELTKERLSIKRMGKLRKRLYTSYIGKKNVKLKKAKYTGLPRYNSDVRHTWVLLRHVMKEKNITTYTIEEKEVPHKTLDNEKQSEVTFTFAGMSIKTKYFGRSVLIAILMLYIVEAMNQEEQYNESHI